MEVREAVHAAKTYIADLFSDEGITHLGLEEIEMGQDGCWRVTVGFSRTWGRDQGVPAILGGAGARQYKLVRVNDEDGRILSVKDRVLAASA